MAGGFIDTHAHLQEADFEPDIEEVMGRAAAAGVRTVVVPGVDVASSQAAARLADRHPGLYFAAGIHPHEASTFEPGAIARLRELLRHPRVVAVGEIGLDYYRMHSSRPDQSRTFEAMLELAGETLLPVIVHQRDAPLDVHRALHSWSMRHGGAYGGRPMGVLHYFSGTPQEARAYVELGFLISVHTSVTHPKAYQLRQVVSELALDCLVMETDSPYGAPQSVRGKRNEPAFVTDVAAKIAEVQGVTVAEVARVTSLNASRLFPPLAATLTDVIGASA